MEPTVSQCAAHGRIWTVAGRRPTKHTPHHTEHPSNTGIAMYKYYILYIVHYVMNNVCRCVSVFAVWLSAGQPSTVCEPFWALQLFCLGVCVCVLGPLGSVDIGFLSLVFLSNDFLHPLGFIPFLRSKTSRSSSYFRPWFVPCKRVFSGGCRMQVIKRRQLRDHILRLSMSTN